MTREETQKILMSMQAAYPNYKPLDKTIVVNTWCELLGEYTYEQVSAALKAYILSDTSGFAPSIGQLVAKIDMLTKPQELNEMEAWALVRKALKNGIYGAEEEFAKLPPAVQKAVGHPDSIREWAMTETATVETVIQSNFIRTYSAVIRRQQEVSRLPEAMKVMISKVNENAGLEVRTYVPVAEKREERRGIPMPEYLKAELEGLRRLYGSRLQSDLESGD